jgi:hypothetical protein
MGCCQTLHSVHPTQTSLSPVEMSSSSEPQGQRVVSLISDIFAAGC